MTYMLKVVRTTVIGFIMLYSLLNGCGIQGEQAYSLPENGGKELGFIITPLRQAL
jgi:hypothetical protein